jgi:regulatory protein
MPIITSLEPQAHDPERLNVFLDGRFGFGASKLLVLARGLSEGKELGDDEVEALRRDDAVERAHAAALNYLSYRPRSRREIDDYFRKKGTEPEIAEAVIGRLLQVGLLDDREFARFWVDNRLTFRPRGSRALRAEMRQKGLDAEVIDEVLDSLEGEEELAYEAGLKKVRSFERLDDREFFSKMAAHLQRRGFPWDAASAATRRLLSERGSGADAEE